MPTLSEFLRAVFVPKQLWDKHPRTISEYQSTVNLVTKTIGELPVDKMAISRDDFVAEMRKKQAADATIDKHIRHLNAIFKKAGVPLWKRYDVPETIPKKVFDNEFQALYRAFSNEKQFPTHLPEKLRPHFWQTVMVFAATTALRREAILGVEFRDVNWDEKYLVVRKEVDKKKKQRYKPLTPQVLEMITLLRRTNTQIEKVFTWKHCTKSWYSCWNRAQSTAGCTIGLHDLKRFSGELALRAGATQLELMAHMDHADIKTTLKHYVRPTTTKLVQKFLVPIPMEFEPPPPPDLLTLGNEERTSGNNLNTETAAFVNAANTAPKPGRIVQ